MNSNINAYIGLGSNIDNPIEHVAQAFKDISLMEKTTLIAQSNLYRTKSFLPELPDFINAVAHVVTHLSAQMLLRNLLAIEDQHGRVRTKKWGSRTLDCDLLLYGNEQINDANLIVPHPHLHERATVLYPLADINSELCLPDGVSLRELLKDIPPDGIKKLEEASCPT